MESRHGRAAAAVVAMAAVLTMASAAGAEVHLGVASDATPWLLGGYSGIGMVEVDALPSWRFSLEVWGMDFPEFFVELAEANRDEGWTRRVELGVGLYADHHLGDTGWHVGGALNLMRSTLGREGFDRGATLTTLEVLVRGGYRWLPMGDEGLFVNPWLAVGQLNPLDEARVGGERFVEAPVQFLGTVHVGWRFGGL